LINLPVIPRWNNVIIQHNLRKFISLLTKVKGFEEFFNLGRNTKYRALDTNWEFTFEALNADIISTETDFTSTKRKEKKIKLLIEEIATYEQVKKSHLLIYENFPCPFCTQTRETFNHVWTCIERRSNIIDIIIFFKENVKRLINQEETKISEITTSDLDTLDNLW
jgi:hypothetical protein